MVGDLNHPRSMPIDWKYAEPDDASILAKWNHQLIRDEGHRNEMPFVELEERMRSWLHAEYKAVVFSASDSQIGYALFRRDGDGIYLRQFFIMREHRRKGFGRECFELLRRQVWPQTARLTVEVLIENAPAISFWRAVGYIDYSLKLEIQPGR